MHRASPFNLHMAFGSPFVIPPPFEMAPCCKLSVLSRLYEVHVPFQSTRLNHFKPMTKTGRHHAVINMLIKSELNGNIESLFHQVYTQCFHWLGTSSDLSYVLFNDCGSLEKGC